MIALRALLKERVLLEISSLSTLSGGGGCGRGGKGVPTPGHSGSKVATVIPCFLPCSSILAVSTLLKALF